MKLGLFSTVFWENAFEEVIDNISNMGLEYVELACWPQNSGVTHLDITSMDDGKISYIKSYCDDRKVKISSLAYYPNPLDPDLSAREFCIKHIYRLIDASAALDVNMISTFIGRDPKKSIDENMDIMCEVWRPIISYAESKKVKIAIENCAMLFHQDHWPGGLNLMTTPVIWRRVFELLDSPSLGLNFDPSHFVWQQLNYIKPIYEFREKIFHIHFKDVMVNREKLEEIGVMSIPEEYMTYKIPGSGDINWSEFITALKSINYSGPACIEVEDGEYQSSRENILIGINKTIKYLGKFI